MKHKLLRILPFLLLGGVLGLAAAPAAFEAAGVKATDGETTVSYAVSDFLGKGTSSTGSKVTVVKNPITFIADYAYGHEDELRVYSKTNNYVRISTSLGSLSSISFTFNGSNNGGLSTSYSFTNGETEWKQKVIAKACITAVSVTVSTADITVDSISLDTSSVTKTYTQGESISYSGLKVTASYSNEKSGVLDSTKYSISPASGTVLNNVGSETVSVTYSASSDIKTTSGQDITETFNVSVVQGEKPIIYSKVNSTSDLNVGDQIIFVSETANKAAKGTLTSNTTAYKRYLDTDDIVIKNHSAEISPSSSVGVYTVEAGSIANTFSFKNESNRYLSTYAIDKDGIKFVDSKDAASSWTVDLEASSCNLKSNIANQAFDSYVYLRYNVSTFRAYKASSSVSETSIYKYSSGAERINVQSSASIIEGSSLTISSTPEKFTPSSYSWTVSDSEVLEVVGDNNKQSVTVKGLKPGSANLTITANGDDELSATCVVTVIAKKDAVIENGEYFIADYSGSHVLNVNLEDIVGPDYADSSVMWNIQNNGVDGDTYTISNGSNYLIHNPNIKNSSLDLTTDSSTYWIAEKVEDGVYNLAYSETGNLLSCNPGANTGSWFAYDNPTGDQAKIKLLKLGNLIDFSVTGPTKKTYYVGEKLSTTNLKVIANFDNGAHPDVTSKVVWDDLVAGHSATGKITIGGLERTVTVDGLSILGPVADSMQVTGLRDTYLIGEMPSQTIEEVKVTYSDGDAEEVKTLNDGEFVVSPDKVSSSTTKIVVSMKDHPEVKYEKEITPEHAKYFATNMIEIGDKVTLGTTVGAKDGNITGGREIAMVDGALNSHPFGYLPTPDMEFEVVQGVSAGSYAFKYNNMYLTSNGKTLDFGHVTSITAAHEDDGTWTFDYPYMFSGWSEPFYVTFTEDAAGSDTWTGYGYKYAGGDYQIQGDAIRVENEMVITLDVYLPGALTPTEEEIDCTCEMNGALVIYLPSTQEVNTKNSFTCNYVQSQNDWVDDYWEICPLNEPEKHVYLNADSYKFGVGTNVDYDVMLYRDMTKDFSQEIKSLSVSIPEDMPTTVELGEPYNWVGITVKAKYANTTKKLPLGAYEVDIPSTDTYGDKTCTVTYGTTNNKVTATFKITVVGGYQPFIKQNTYEIFVDDTLTFTTTEEPPVGEPVTWSSSNPSLADFEDPHVGNLTAYKSGKVTITVTSFDGYYSDSKDLTVSQRPEGMSFDIHEGSVKVGETLTITPTVTPDDAKNKTVLFSSSDESIAFVDKKGVVTGIKPGTATITGITQGKGTGEEAGYTDTCVVTVQEAPKVDATGVSLDCTSKELKLDSSFNLIATVSPSNATIKNVTWSSNHENIATVDNNGKVTGKDTGQCDITVKTVDGGFTATCHVTVKKSVDPIPVTSISLDITSKKVNAGDEFILTATVNPSNADSKQVTFRSDSDAVTVTNLTATTAKVVAVSDGQATITASCGGKSATCSVVVGDAHVNSVSLNKTTLNLVLNSSEKLVATIDPSYADNKNVTWSSSNDSVATVDSNGNVTAIAVGTATITVTTVDGGKTATCTVNVTEKPVEDVKVESVYLSQDSIELAPNDKSTLVATINPENATNKNVTWSSSNTNVASVDANGVVTAKAVGEAVITVTTVDGGKKATCNVKVTNNPTPIVSVESVSLSKETTTLDIGESETLIASINPQNASNKKVVWYSSDSSVATVDQNGKIVGVKEGTTTITVKTLDGGKTATCIVKVEDKARREQQGRTILIASGAAIGTVGVGCGVGIPVGLHFRKRKHLK